MTARSASLSALPRFLMVGGLGFAVDAGVLVALTSGLGIAPLPARLVAIVVAICATWVLHRAYTFRSTDPGRLGEWSRFLGVNAVGAGFNYALYAAALAIAPGLTPFAALVVASACAVAINFLGSALFAFRAEHRAS